MTCNEVIKYIEKWAPKEICWIKDNPGIQVGSGKIKVKNILLSLDANIKVVDEAVNKGCNFIITHHPLIFNPLRRIETSSGGIAAIIEKLIKNDITLYSAHTNLDYTKNGVSFALAKALKLNNIRFLTKIKSRQFKFTLFVPEKDLEKVAAAIFNAGGGEIGDYTNCSFRTPGTGTFKGNSESNPSIGRKGEFVKTPEIKLEVIVDSWNLSKVISAVKETHPYEEPAYDIIPLENLSVNYGIGAVGNLKQSLKRNDFLKHVSENLKSSSLRFSDLSGKNKMISSVAVCGGSGSEYFDDAVSAGADAFITADVKYHAFQEAGEKILMIDAGHYETEIFSLNEVKKKLDGFLREKKIKVLKFSGSTNPVSFYNY
jgi:dinuclear metal center YbgI/SA1388 family protein